MSDNRDITGVWYGRWTSPDSDVAPNGFIALLDEEHGLVSGSISERDPDEPNIVSSAVAGLRAGARVEFVKQYDSEYMSHAVHYDGAVDAAGTTVAGRWSFAAYSGDFVMERELFSTDELEDESEIELVDGQDALLRD